MPAAVLPWCNVEGVECWSYNIGAMCTGCFHHTREHHGSVLMYLMYREWGHSSSTMQYWEQA